MENKCDFCDKIAYTSYMNNKGIVYKYCLDCWQKEYAKRKS